MFRNRIRTLTMWGFALLVILGFGISLALAKSEGQVSPVTPSSKDVAVEAKHESTAPEAGQPLSSFSRKVTPEEFAQLVRDGYSPADVAEASDLAWLYGSDLHSVLTRRQSGAAWEQIKADEEHRWSLEMAERAKHPGKYVPDRVVINMPTVLTDRELDDLTASGQDRNDVLKANYVADLLGLDFRHVMAEKTPNGNWAAALRDAFKKTSAKERQEQREQSRPAGRAKAALAKVGITATTATVPLLSQGEIDALVTAGADREQVGQMVALAVALGVDPHEIVASKRSDQSWVDAVKEAYAHKPKHKGPNETTANAGETADILAQLAQQSAGIPQVALTVVPNREVTQAAIDMGLTPIDAIVADELARLSGKQPQEVLRMKAPSVSWSDLGESLLSASALGEGAGAQ